MDVAQFELKRWVAKYEHEAIQIPAESGIRSLDTSRFDLAPGDARVNYPTLLRSP